MKLAKLEIKSAVEAFKLATIKHSIHQSTLDLALFMLELSPNVDIVNLVGPTGVGKSTLHKAIVDAFHEDALERMAPDPSHVPIITSNALASGHKRFDWKALYRGALHALGDPFAQQRKASASEAFNEFRRLTGESASAAALRQCLECEFARRGTLVWIIDEAQHLVFGGSSGDPGDQFDVAKSISQNTGVKLLLTGPGVMEAGLGTSPQLARRSMTLHYRRYLHTNEEHVMEFANIVQTMFSMMRPLGHPSVGENIQFFYSGCAGCVGILKGWLARAYGLALRNGSSTLTLAHLRETRLDAQTMKIVMNDIRAEEEQFEAPANDVDYLRIVTGPQAPAYCDSPTGKSSYRGANARGEGIHKRRVGERAIGPRDKVGQPVMPKTA